MAYRIAAPRIRKLAEIAKELRQGRSFSVTRLTSIKTLCKDPHAGARFAIYLARATQNKMDTATCPDHIDPKDWTQHKKLVAEAISQMEDYIETPTTERSLDLKELLLKVEKVQEYGGHTAWGNPIRVIKNTYVLVIEDALQCILFPDTVPYRAYQMARDYAERYDARYGNGLIPESAPLVEDIANFWCEYYFGQTLEQWFTK